MALLSWLALAHAQTVVLEHRIPSTTELGLSAGGVFGVDVWRDAAALGPGGGPSGELSLSGGGEHGYARTLVGAGYGGLLQGWTSEASVDGHLFEAGARNASGPGVLFQARGSAAQQWVEVAPSAAFVRPTYRVLLSPLLRQGTGIYTNGLALETDASWSPTARVELSGAIRGALHGNPDIPHVGVLHGAIELAPTLATEVGVAISVVAAVGGLPAAAMGLAPGDSVVTRPGAWARFWPTNGIALQVEGAFEAGTGSIQYTRGRILAGLHGRIGRARAPSEDPIEAGTVLLRFVDPDATQVAVAGSFTGWEPLEMIRSESGWELEILLVPGVHEYVYIVDGLPVLPPETSTSRDDGFGGRSGVLVVGGEPL